MFFIVVCYIVGAFILLWTLGWNYSVFRDKCFSKEIPNKISFFMQLIPFFALAFSFGGWVLELLLTAPRKLQKEIKNCYEYAFPKENKKKSK